MNKKTKILLLVITLIVTVFGDTKMVLANEYIGGVAEDSFNDTSSGKKIDNSYSIPDSMLSIERDYKYYTGKYTYYEQIAGLRIAIVNKNGVIVGNSADFVGDSSNLTCSNCGFLQKAGFYPSNDTGNMTIKIETGKYQMESIKNLSNKGSRNYTEDYIIIHYPEKQSYSGDNSKCYVWNTVYKGEYSVDKFRTEMKLKEDQSDCVFDICYEYVNITTQESRTCITSEYPEHYKCTHGGNARDCLCNVFKKEVANKKKANPINNSIFLAGNGNICKVKYNYKTKNYSFLASNKGNYRIGKTAKVPSPSNISISKGTTSNLSNYLKNNTTAYYWSELSGKYTAEQINDFMLNGMYNNLDAQYKIYEMFDTLGITEINILDKELLSNYYITFEPLLYVRYIDRFHKTNGVDDPQQYMYYGTVSEVYSSLKEDGFFYNSGKIWNGFKLFAKDTKYDQRKIGSITTMNTGGTCASLGFGSALGNNVMACGVALYNLEQIFWDKSFACHYEVNINGSTDCTKSDTGHVYDIVNGSSLTTAISNSKSWTCIQKSETVYGSDFYYDKSLSQKTKCKVYCVEDISYKFPNSIIDINAGRRITVSGDLTTSDDNISPISIAGTKVCRATGDSCTAKLENEAKNDAYSDLNPQLTIKFNGLYNSTVKYLNTYTLVPNSSVSVSSSSNIVTINKDLSYSIKEDSTTGEYYHYVCKNGISYHNPNEKEKCKYLEYSNVPISFDTPPGIYTYTITMNNLFGKNQKFYGIISKGHIADINDETETLGNYITQYKNFFVPSGSYLPNGFISAITSQRATAFEDLKNTSCYQFYGCTEEDGKVKCTINAKNPSNTNKTILYENFYYCVVNIKSILNNINRTKTGSGNFGTYTCNYKVTNEFKEKNSIIYRPISLTDPFPGELGEGRTPGTNWNNQDIIESVIKTARGTSSDSPYELYKKEPIYEFELTSNNIYKIREYNDSNDYTNFDLECKLDSDYKSTGENCISNFIKNGISKGYFTKASGTCYGKTASGLDSCKGG